MVTDLHGFYDSSGCCKDLTNGVSAVIFTGMCYAKQMCFVTCWTVKKHCTEQNQDPHSAAFWKSSCPAIGLLLALMCRVCWVNALLRWIGCKVLATLEIVVMQKCADNFQMYKVFGSIWYKHMILIKLFLLQAEIKMYFCTWQEGEF